MKNVPPLARIIVAFFILGGWSHFAAAQWELLGDNSDINFISVKNSAVAERHGFTNLSGSVSSTGEVDITITLDSVETMIPIRNERVRELLFETVDFPVATIRGEVGTAVLEVARNGGVMVTELPVTVALHGIEKEYLARVVLSGTAGGSLLVVASHPIIVNAEDFGLDKGIGLLREVAGLRSISTAVPVSFQLLFAPGQ